MSMENLSINFNDPSFFSCHDSYIAKYLDNNYNKEIIDKLDDQRLSNIICHIKNKEIILDDLGDRLDNVINQIDIYYLRKIISKDKNLLKHLNKDNIKLLNEIYSYDRDKIGFYISNKNIFKSSELSFDVINKINNSSNVIYVIDDDNNYLGACYISDLLKENETIDKFIKNSYPKIDSNLHTSDFIKYNHHYYMDSYPVLNGDKLFGVISNHSLNSLLEYEMNDDYYKLAGITENRLNNDGEHLGRKLPWLFVSTLTAFAVIMMFSPFIGRIIKYPIIGIYMPLILMVSSAVGITSLGSTLTIIRKHKEEPLKSIRLFINEIKKSIVIGLVLSIITFVIIYFFLVITKINYLDIEYYHSDSLKFAIGIVAMMFTSIIISSIVGFAIPTIIDHLGYDYSIGTMILFTSLSDLLGLIIIFTFSYFLF